MCRDRLLLIAIVFINFTDHTRRKMVSDHLQTPNASIREGSGSVCTIIYQYPEIKPSTLD